MMRSDMNSPDTVLFGRSELWREYHQFEISFMNKMTSEGINKYWKMQSTSRTKPYCQLYLAWNPLDDSDWRLLFPDEAAIWGGRGRRVSGHYRQWSPASETQNMYSAPGSKTTIISTSQAIYNILETDQKYNPDISQHSLINSETVSGQINKRLLTIFHPQKSEKSSCIFRWSSRQFDEVSSFSSRVHIFVAWLGYEVI